MQLLLGVISLRWLIIRKYSMVSTPQCHLSHHLVWYAHFIFTVMELLVECSHECGETSGFSNICDRACKNQPSERKKSATFFVFALS